MIPAPKSPLLWYNPACSLPNRIIAEGVAAGIFPQRRARAAYDPTPKPGPFRGILKLVLRGFASHGRTDRPSAWQGRRFALPLHPSRSALTPEPSGEPSCSLRPMTGALPSVPTKAHRPWNQTRAIAPLDHSPELSHPGTHDQSFRALDIEQAAFRPLHPDEGYSLPRPRAGHAVPAPRPGFTPDPTMGRPWSRRQDRRTQPQSKGEGGMADDLTMHRRLADLPAPAADNDPLADARLMARAAGFGDRVDLFIIARARGHRIMPEGTA